MTPPTDVRVWRIVTLQGEAGHVVWHGGHRFTYRLTAELGKLIQAEIRKTSGLPDQVLATVLDDFFSKYLRKISGGVCWAQLLPEFGSGAPVLPLEERFRDPPTELGEEVRPDTNDRYLYLRRFRSLIPSVSIVAEAIAPASLIMAAPVGVSAVTRWVHSVDRTMHGRWYARVSLLSLDNSTWVTDVARAAGGMQGIVIDTRLFDRRRGRMPSGLHAEMLLSLMLEPTVARVYLSNTWRPLPSWIPPDLVVRLPVLGTLSSRRRNETVARVRRALSPSVQSRVAGHFDRYRRGWEREKVMDENSEGAPDSK